MKIEHKGIFARIMSDKKAASSHIRCFHLIASNIDENNSCYFTNDQIGESLGIDKKSASNVISWLEKNKYIGRKIYYKNESKEIAYRATYLIHYPIHSVDGYPIHSVDGSKPPKGVEIESKAKAFKKPTHSEISDYCKESGYPLTEIDLFLNFYESKGWLVGKNKMVSWKSAFSGWMSRKGIAKTNTFPDLKKNRDTYLNKVIKLSGIDYIITLYGIVPTKGKNQTALDQDTEVRIYDRLSK